jgi:hypothetical protein
MGILVKARVVLAVQEISDIGRQLGLRATLTYGASASIGFSVA